MRKRLLPIVLAIIILTSLLNISAFAASTSAPTAPGLKIDNVKFSIEPSLRGNYNPSYMRQAGVTLNPFSATITVPRDATYICIEWWDHGEKASSGRGYLFNGYRNIKVNDGWAAEIASSEGVSSRKEDGYNGVIAECRYITIPASSFQKNSGEKLTIEQTRYDYLGRQSKYTLTYWINWAAPLVPPQKPTPSAPTTVGYHSLNQRLTNISSTMEFRYYTDKWSQWGAYGSGSNVSHNMYPELRHASHYKS